METLNELFSSLATRRRYEVWFVRLGLADGSGAWWLRYLLMNPGRGGCPNKSQGAPVQVWATWFPHNAKPQTFIQGASLDDVELSRKGARPFHLRNGRNAIEENSCVGVMQANGHRISWDLHYSSSFRTTLSNKGWIGFSRTPHSDAVFSGQIILDDRTFAGNPLGFGVQGHNCGYRHRSFWTWTHAFFSRPDGLHSTLEALVYDMPLGLVFRKAVLWHDGKQHIFRNLREARRDPENLRWDFDCRSRDIQLHVAVDGSGQGMHILPYLKTDCSGSFEVANNSIATAALCLRSPGERLEKLETKAGAVLEMGGQVREIRPAMKPDE